MRRVCFSVVGIGVKREDTYGVTCVLSTRCKSAYVLSYALVLFVSVCLFVAAFFVRHPSPSLSVRSSVWLMVLSFFYLGCTYRRLEHRVCGEREIDLEFLRQHTACESEALKERLFEVLQSFTNDQLQRFLRFVSGRSRLPTTGGAGGGWRMTVDYETPDVSRM